MFKHYFIFSLLFFSAFYGWTQNYTLDWAYSPGSVNDDQGNAITTDSLGNMYVAGKFSGMVDFDPGPGTTLLNSGATSASFIQKFDPNGHLDWAIKIIDDGFASVLSISVDHASNVIVGGLFSDSVNFYSMSDTTLVYTSYTSNAFIYKLDPNGNNLWLKHFGNTSHETKLLDLSLDESNAIYSTGIFENTTDFDPGTGTFNLSSAGSNQDIFIQKLDSDGNFIWAKRIGNTDYEEGSKIAVFDNRVYVTGWYKSYVDFDPSSATFVIGSKGYTDIYLLSLNLAGDFIWAESFGSTITDHSSGLGVSADGEIYLTGNYNGDIDMDPGPGTYTIPCQGTNDFFVAKLDSSGQVIWVQSFGSDNDELSSCLTSDPTGGVMVGGVFYSTLDFDPGNGVFNMTPPVSNALFLLKLDQNGSFQWAGSLGTMLPYANNYFSEISYDNNGALYATGAYEDSIDFDMGPGVSSLNSNGFGDVFIFKLNPSLNSLQSLHTIDFNLYPNPANTFLNVELVSSTTGVINILDMEGKQIYSQTIMSVTSVIDLRNIQSGTYIVEIIQETARSRKLLIKN